MVVDIPMIFGIHFTIQLFIFTWVSLENYCSTNFFSITTNCIVLTFSIIPYLLVHSISRCPADLLFFKIISALQRPFPTCHSILLSFLDIFVPFSLTLYLRNHYESKSATSMEKSVSVSPLCSSVASSIESSQPVRKITGQQKFHFHDVTLHRVLLNIRFLMSSTMSFSSA